MDDLEYKLCDLVDIRTLSNILDNLYKTAGIPSAIIDLDGKILAGAGWQRICLDFHRKHPEAEKICLQSDTHIAEKINAGEPYIIYECPHGLVDSCCPVIIEGHHIANVFTGQILHSPLNDKQVNRFKNQAKLYEFDETDYLDALSEVPVFPIEKHKDILDLLSQFTGQIAKMGLTQLKILEQSKKQKINDQKFQRLLESTSTVPWELDLASNMFTYMGKQVEQILGYPAESWVDMSSWAERVHLEDRDDAVQFCEIETKKGHDHDFIYRATHVDGSVRWIRDIISVVMIDNKPAKLVGFMHDITEQKVLAEEKAKLEFRLLQAQKMEAIGTLAGGIAHDFNNILAAILGYAEMAKDDSPNESSVAKDLNKILEAGNRAKNLVQQILAFSRQAEVKRIPLQLQPLIKEGLKLLRSSIPSTISITENIESRSGVVLADPTQIHQILMNLCTNAYQAMGETGGALAVALRTTVIGHNEKELSVYLDPGEYIEITVTDTGSGIAPDDIEKIFDPYFTTKGIGEGTGMGLSIIHGIMTDYKGAITVESELGNGSTFHVYFPAVGADVLPQITKDEDIPRGNERILFVDDEVLLAKMGKNMLERLGYHVTVHHYSKEALETFHRTPADFDLVITDQTMPDITGSDLSRRMLEIRPDIPIILCTGFSNLIDADSAKALGIKEFALKPLTKRTIAKLIRKVLDGNN